MTRRGSWISRCPQLAPSSRLAPVISVGASLPVLQTPGKRLRRVAMLCLSHQHENENSSDVELILQMNVFQLPRFGSHALSPSPLCAFAFTWIEKWKKMLGSHSSAGSMEIRQRPGSSARYLRPLTQQSLHLSSSHFLTDRHLAQPNTFTSPNLSRRCFLHLKCLLLLHCLLSSYLFFKTLASIIFLWLASFPDKLNSSPPSATFVVGRFCVCVCVCVCDSIMLCA